MAIEKDQKRWIKAMVKNLGSIERVEKLYKTDSPVDKWANAYARKIFSIKRTPVK